MNKKNRKENISNEAYRIPSDLKLYRGHHISSNLHKIYMDLRTMSHSQRTDIRTRLRLMRELVRSGRTILTEEVKNLEMRVARITSRESGEMERLAIRKRRAREREQELYDRGFRDCRHYPQYRSPQCDCRGCGGTRGIS